MSLSVTTNIPLDGADDGVATSWTSTFAEAISAADSINATFILKVDEVVTGSGELGTPELVALFQELVSVIGVLDADAHTLLHEIAYVADVAESRFVRISTLVETGQVNDILLQVNVVNVPVLVEEATVAGAIFYEVDFLGLTEEVATVADLVTALRETSTRVDEIGLGVSSISTYGQFVTSTFTEEATARGVLSFALELVLEESATATDAASAHSITIARFDETATVQDTVARIVETLTLLRELAYASGILLDLSPQAVGSTGRTVNIETWALSRYTGLAPYELGKEWAVGPDGVYRKGSSAVAAYVETGDMDLTSRGETTRMLWVDTDAYVAADLAITATALQTGHDPLSATYKETRNANRVEVFPIKLGRKLRGERWRLRISNPSGGDFRLLRLILHPVLTV